MKEEEIEQKGIEQKGIEQEGEIEMSEYSPTSPWWVTASAIQKCIVLVSFLLILVFTLWLIANALGHDTAMRQITNEQARFVR
jgi:hypothetical protein